MFTAIVHIMTSILCYLIIYEKVTNTCAKNRQYLKKTYIKNNGYTTLVLSPSFVLKIYHENEFLCIGAAILD